ncbi:Asparagine synthase (glutamine-hydrolyzing) [Aquirufa nivalisilvae]|uniref:asparagine synthase (glutamine-hydrolyzing) n=1 Tax=Aquirufa nivalisilvae TaxID=2516557 RepID=A0A2S2DY49_9BACT|nr:asparagine synthase (glutamine-hydrolyzing) [Aquirufa nivalisilvae]AWL10325.1 Asparagine synthase (glutamine-hydrolyzing) [Aquirufa nivalisilvae]
MCGIVGIIGLLEVNSSTILTSISHRGPDSQGFFQEGELFLGHTRLSIQDLSENGNQPMFSKDGRFVIVFNGEIYNHLEIRQSLGEFDFKSSGDTETVLYAYIKHGIECLSMFNGIFSFSVFDLHTKELFIARDHFGVKPLYLYQDEHLFLFSSEIKTFLSLPIQKDLDNEALMNYLSYLWSPGEKTPFKLVKKLLPGHYLKFNISEFQQAKPISFYQPNLDGEHLQDTEEELINQLDQLLIQAVDRQMLSDVPVGFFLSGGLDSTLLVAIAKKIYPERKFPCFTIDIDSQNSKMEDFADDLVYATKAADFLEVDLHIVKATIDIVDSFDQMIWHLDEPQADAAPINVLNIAKLAREKGIKVLIGGTGGDDLFSGYRRHQALLLESILRKIPNGIRQLLKHIIGILPIKSALFRRIRKISENMDLSPTARMKGYFKWLSSERIYSLFSKSIQQELNGYDPSLYFDELLLQIPQEKSVLNQMLYWELKTFLVDHNLNYTDKMGMAVGVEIRVPFLDVLLVEFAQKLPPEMKMKGKETKYLLKKVAERYLPKEIIYRPKTGFGAPVRKWITEDMSDMLEQRLSKSNIEKQGIFDYDAVWKLINDNKENKIDASYPIWAILAIDSWINQFSLRKYEI